MQGYFFKLMEINENDYFTIIVIEGSWRGVSPKQGKSATARALDSHSDPRNIQAQITCGRKSYKTNTQFVDGVSITGLGGWIRAEFSSRVDVLRQGPPDSPISLQKKSRGKQCSQSLGREVVGPGELPDTPLSQSLVGSCVWHARIKKTQPSSSASEPTENLRARSPVSFIRNQNPVEGAS